MLTKEGAGTRSNQGLVNEQRPPMLTHDFYASIGYMIAHQKQGCYCMVPSTEQLVNEFLNVSSLQHDNYLI